MLPQEAHPVLLPFQAQAEARKVQGQGPLHLAPGIGQGPLPLGSGQNQGQILQVHASLQGQAHPGHPVVQKKPIPLPQNPKAPGQQGLKDPALPFRLAGRQVQAHSPHLQTRPGQAHPFPQNLPLEFGNLFAGKLQASFLKGHLSLPGLLPGHLPLEVPVELQGEPFPAVPPFQLSLPAPGQEGQVQAHFPPGTLHSAGKGQGAIAEPLKPKGHALRPQLAGHPCPGNPHLEALKPHQGKRHLPVAVPALKPLPGINPFGPKLPQAPGQGPGVAVGQAEGGKIQPPGKGKPLSQKIQPQPLSPGQDRSIGSGKPALPRNPSPVPLFRQVTVLALEGRTLVRQAP